MKEYMHLELVNKEASELKQIKKDLLEAIEKQRRDKYMLIGQILFYQDMLNKEKNK
jgi:hypothetical protein